MRICVIGNSHVGMLKSALDGAKGYPIQLTWFAKAGPGIDRVEFDDTGFEAKEPRLVAALKQSNMPTRVKFEELDGLVLVGNTLSVFQALYLLKTHKISTWPSGESQSVNIRSRHKTPLRRQLLSYPAYISAMVEYIQSNATHRFAKTLRSYTDIPIQILPQPFPSVKIIEAPRRKYPGFLRLLRTQDGLNLAESLGEAHRRAFSEVNCLTILTQPPQTVEYGFLTSSKFTYSARVLDGSKFVSENDVLHANAGMGKLYLDLIAKLTPCLKDGTGPVPI